MQESFSQGISLQVIFFFAIESSLRDNHPYRPPLKSQMVCLLGLISDGWLG